MDKVHKLKSFGAMIKTLREAKGKLLRQAAADLELDQAILSKLENCLILPSEEQLQRLSSYYKVNLDELKVLSYADRIVSTVGGYKHADRVIALVKEQLNNYEIGNRINKRKARGSK